MVAQGNAVIPHGIDHVDLKVALKHREIGCSLTEIPGMEHQDILFTVSLDDTVPVSRPLYDTSVTGIFAGTFRFHVAVGIIEMDNSKPPLSVCTRMGNHGSGRSYS